MNKLLLLFLLALIGYNSFAQQTIADSSYRAPKKVARDSVKQIDLIDIGYHIIGKDASKRTDTVKIKPGKVYFSGAPSLAYQTQTGLAGVFVGNFAFYNGRPADTKISNMQVDFDYTQKKQILLPIWSNIWSKKNKYNFSGIWRYLKYPEQIYGIGGYTTDKDAYTINYDNLSIYEYVLRKVSNNFYVGPGVQFDHYWNISEQGVAPGRVTDYDKYGFSQTATSTGIALNFLYNNVPNSINPAGGTFYANVILRQNLTWLGSNQNWSSAIFDIRKYFPVGHKGNVFALWSYDWLILSGNPPYLSLPSNGWDTYANTGRGYVQSRFAGKQMFDLEAEYRYGILRNGLLGGDFFVGAMSFSEFNNSLQVILPSCGGGVRIKFNKFSRSNIAIDYGWGINGSHGVFINLGEVF